MSPRPARAPTARAISRPSGRFLRKKTSRTRKAARRRQHRPGRQVLQKELEDHPEEQIGQPARDPGPGRSPLPLGEPEEEGQIDQQEKPRRHEVGEPRHPAAGLGPDGGGGGQEEAVGQKEEGQPPRLVQSLAPEPPEAVPRQLPRRQGDQGEDQPHDQGLQQGGPGEEDLHQVPGVPAVDVGGDQVADALGQPPVPVVVGVGDLGRQPQVEDQGQQDRQGIGPVRSDGFHGGPSFVALSPSSRSAHPAGRKDAVF